MTDRKFAEDKPADCTFCYFWDKKKNGCSQPECYYMLAEEPDGENKDYDCRGCPYGRHSPCIGYCLSKLIREMKLRV